MAKRWRLIYGFASYPILVVQPEYSFGSAVTTKGRLHNRLHFNNITCRTQCYKEHEGMQVERTK